MKQLEIQQYILGLTDEAFKFFLNEIGRIPLLTEDEKIELVRLIQKGGEEAVRAQSALVNSYLRIIVSIANKYKHLSLSLQELTSVGISGLVDFSSIMYDENRVFDFSSYAIWWIRHYMLSAIVNRDAENKKTETFELFCHHRKLLCFPKSEAVDPYEDNGLTALAASNKEEELFLNNAHLFYRNSDFILTDSRMFFAPVLIDNGMTYQGSTGPQYPTLGMYIEWWRNCEVDVTRDSDGHDALTYRIAGNPLSGTNGCKCVYPDGHIERIVHPAFSPMWSLFQKISKRYHEAKVLFDAYTLDEVVQILLKCEKTNNSSFGSSLK